MAVLGYFRLLLMGVALSIAYSAPSDDGEMMRSFPGPLSRMQEIAGSYREQDDPYSFVADNLLPSAAWEGAEYEENFNSMLSDDLRGAVQGKTPPKKNPSSGNAKRKPITKAKTTVDPIKKKRCKTEALSKGYTSLSPSCKKMLKTDRMLCQIQAEQKKAPLDKLCSKLVAKGSSSCGVGTQQCHVPGSSSPAKTCVKTDKPQSNPQYYNAAAYRPGQSNKNDLEVHTIPIGQGDCTVIYCPGGKNAVLFDCGSTAGGDNRAAPDDVKKYFENVDHVTIIISHGDQDHYNYLPRIFDTKPLFGKITQVITGGPASDCSCARSGIVDWLKALGKKVISTGPSNPFLGDKNLCNDPSVHFEIIAAGSKGAKNERSIVMKLSRDNNPSSLLFSGDMEGNVAKNLAATRAGDLQSSHYKIAHHGASTKANKPDWLKAISPVEAHVSHAYIGQYGHPRCEAIKNLLDVKSVGTTTTLGSTHPFTCVNKVAKGKAPDIDSKDICHRLFSTSPTADTMCVIKLSFQPNKSPATTEYYCDKVANWQSAKGADKVVVCPKTSDDDDDDL